MTNLDFIPRTWKLLMKPCKITCKREEMGEDKKAERWGKMKKSVEASRENEN